MAWVDINNDGDIGLYLTNNGTNGSTEMTAERLPRSAGVDDGGGRQSTSWADFDEDGFVDLMMTTAGTGSRLYQNYGDNTFTDVTVAAGLTSTEYFGAAWADYDGDGNIDLYLSNDTGVSLSARAFTMQGRTRIFVLRYQSFEGVP